ncbi:MAG: iron ABC transporter permease [Trueperaceae bacterium]|nr:iron ABC transporter permease [Trueperaceae bacterium]
MARAARAPRAGPAAARRAGPVALSLLALAAVLVVSVTVGSVAVTPDRVWGALMRGMAGELAGPADVIVWSVRLPRALLAAGVGAALGLAGTAYQAVFRNPLADPYLLGAASGAGFGAALVMVYGGVVPVLAQLGVGPVAFAFALAAVTVVVVLARRGGHLPVTSLILAGVVVGSSLSAGTSFVMLAARERSTGVLSWLLGSFAFAGWDDVSRVLPAVAVAVLLGVAGRRAFDLLQLGDASARQLGLRVEAFKATVIALATVLTAVAVAACGVIGFVGLITPHAVRLALGPGHATLVPLAAVWGATFLMAADLLARTAIAPAEIPVGVVTALAGGPFFLYLLRRGGGAT